MAKTQMNVRIDEDVKRNGDEVFAQLGYNPTQVIDLLWTFAANSAKDSKRVKELLNDCRFSSEEEAQAYREQVRTAQEGHERLLAEYRKAMDAFGVNPISPLPELSQSELRELAFEERAREKGWL